MELPTFCTSNIFAWKAPGKWLLAPNIVSTKCLIWRSRIDQMVFDHVMEALVSLNNKMESVTFRQKTILSNGNFVEWLFRRLTLLSNDHSIKWPFQFGWRDISSTFKNNQSSAWSSQRGRRLWTFREKFMDIQGGRKFMDIQGEVYGHSGRSFGPNFGYLYLFYTLKLLPQLKQGRNEPE